MITDNPLRNNSDHTTPQDTLQGESVTYPASEVQLRHAPLTSVPYFDAPFYSTHWESLTEESQRRINAHRVKLWNVYKASQRRLNARINQRKACALYRVEISADMLKIRVPGYDYTPQGKPPQRGAITGFSARSRVRMLETLARLRYDGDMAFLTLTYPDEYPQDIRTCKAHFEAFRRRWERAFPSSGAIWKLEAQQRGAPHYHLLIALGGDDAQTVIRDTNHDTPCNPDTHRQHNELTASMERWALSVWTEIVDSGDKHHAIHGAHVAPVKSRRHAYWYVSKYLGKTADDLQSWGRRWGRVGVLDLSLGVVTDMTPREYIHFRRLVRKWLLRRGSNCYAKRIAHTDEKKGLRVFGMGDTSDTPRMPQDSQTWAQLMREAERLTAQDHAEGRVFDVYGRSRVNLRSRPDKPLKTEYGVIT